MFAVSWKSSIITHVQTHTHTHTHSYTLIRPITYLHLIISMHTQHLHARTQLQMALPPDTYATLITHLHPLSPHLAPTFPPSVNYSQSRYLPGNDRKKRYAQNNAILPFIAQLLVSCAQWVVDGAFLDDRFICPCLFPQALCCSLVSCGKQDYCVMAGWAPFLSSSSSSSHCFFVLTKWG